MVPPNEQVGGRIAGRRTKRKGHRDKLDSTKKEANLIIAEVKGAQ